MRKLFFIIACSMVCLFQTITLQAQPNASIFAQFPWISTNNLVQQDRCTTEKIVVYTAGIYSFLLITDANGTEQLYNQDGLFYCQNASNYDCIAAYNLGTPTTTWNCTGASSQDCLAEEEIIQRLKGEQAGCEIVTSISKIEYDGNTYYTYDIGTNPNIPCPTIPAFYYTGTVDCQGQLICESSPTIDVINPAICSVLDGQTKTEIWSIENTEGEYATNQENTTKLPDDFSLIDVLYTICKGDTLTLPNLTRKLECDSGLPPVPAEPLNHNRAFDGGPLNDGGLLNETIPYTQKVFWFNPEAQFIVNEQELSDGTTTSTVSFIPSFTTVYGATFTAPGCGSNLPLAPVMNYYIQVDDSPTCQIDAQPTYIIEACPGEIISLFRPHHRGFSELDICDLVSLEEGGVVELVEEKEEEYSVRVLDEGMVQVNASGQIAQYRLGNTLAGLNCPELNYQFQIQLRPSCTNDACDNYTGTIFFRTCDDGRIFYVIETEDGRIFDPYFDESVTYEPIDGQRVRFDYVDANFPSPCSIAEKAISVTCIEVAENPTNNGDCSKHKGTILFESCDDGTSFFFIRKSTGELLDIYFAEGIDFTPMEGQTVNFDYVVADFTSPCSIADQAVIITCIEEVENSNMGMPVPENFEDYDVIFRMCKGDTLKIPWLSRTFVPDCPCPLCGPPVPVRQLEEWSGSSFTYDRINDKVVLYPDETAAYMVNFPSYTCPPGTVGGVPGPSSTSLLNYLVIVEEDVACTPSLNPEEITFNISACPGDIVQVPAPYSGFCPFAPILGRSKIKSFSSRGSVAEFEVVSNGVVTMRNWIGEPDFELDAYVSFDCPSRIYNYNITCPENTGTSDCTITITSRLCRRIGIYDENDTLLQEIDFEFVPTPGPPPLEVWEDPRPLMEGDTRTYIFKEGNFVIGQQTASCNNTDLEIITNYPSGCSDAAGTLILNNGGCRDLTIFGTSGNLIHTVSPGEPINLGPTSKTIYILMADLDTLGVAWVNGFSEREVDTGGCSDAFDCDVAGLLDFVTCAPTLKEVAIYRYQGNNYVVYFPRENTEPASAINAHTCDSFELICEGAACNSIVTEGELLEVIYSTENCPDFIEIYPWLRNLIDPNYCTTEKVEIFESGTYNYLLVTDATGTAILYNDQGQFYCQNSSNYDCVAAYNLGDPIDSWECGADVENCNCPAVVEPVCGVDGVTYSNACEAACAGVVVAFNTSCTIDPASQCLVTISNTQCRRITVYDTNDRLITTLDPGPFGNAPFGSPTPEWTDPNPLIGNENRTYVLKEGNFILTRKVVTCENNQITTSNPYARGCNDGLSLGIYTNTGCRELTMVNTSSEVVNILPPGASDTLTATNFIYIFLVGNDTIDIKSDVGGDIDSGGCGNNGNNCSTTITNTQCRRIGVYDTNDRLLTRLDPGPFGNGPPGLPIPEWTDPSPLTGNETRTYILKEGNFILTRKTVSCENNEITTSSPYSVGCNDGLSIAAYTNTGCRAMTMVNTSSEVLSILLPGASEVFTATNNIYIFLVGTDTIDIKSDVGGDIDSGGCDGNGTTCSVTISNTQCKPIGIFNEAGNGLTLIPAASLGEVLTEVIPTWTDPNPLAVGDSRTYTIKDELLTLTSKIVTCDQPNINTRNPYGDSCNDGLSIGTFTNTGCRSLTITNTSGSPLATLGPNGTFGPITVTNEIFIVLVEGDTIAVKSDEAGDIDSGGCEGNSSNEIPSNFKDYDMIYRVCKGTSLRLPNPFRMIYCPMVNCGIVGPCEPNGYAQLPEWTGGEVTSISRSVVFSPSQTTVYTATFPDGTCNDTLVIPSSPAYKYLVIVEDTPNCQTSEQTKFEIEACIGEVIVLPVPSHDTLCSGIIGGEPIGTLESQEQNFARFKVQTGGTFMSYRGRESVPSSSITGNNVLTSIYLETSCPLTTYEYTIRIKADCQEPNPNPINFEEYPWLGPRTNPADCSLTHIEEYQQGSYTYLLVTDAQGIEVLYNQDGQFYCQNASNYDCVTAYNLGAPIASWVCDLGGGCAAVYEPVCGVDGKTYGNECEATRAGVAIDYNGECQSLACPQVYEPVCGVDRRTYGNACEAGVAGIGIAYEGECSTTLSPCNLYSNIPADTDLCEACYKDISIYEFQGASHLVYSAQNVECRDSEVIVIDCAGNMVTCFVNSDNGFGDGCNDFFAGATLVETLWTAEDCPSATPSCANNTGTIFFRNCDDGVQYYFIQTEDGRIFDPYFNEDVFYDPIQGQKVNFDFVDADFSSPCSLADKAVNITCIEAAENPSDDGDCTKNRGTIFFEACDDGTSFFFIRTNTGEVLDIYFAEGIEFVKYDGQKVRFDYVAAEFATPCSIAKQAVIITCIEEDTNDGELVNDVIPENFEDFDVIFRVCKGDTLSIPRLTRTFIPNCPCGVPPPGVCGPPGPVTQRERWRGTSIQQTTDKVLLYPSETSTYTVQFLGYSCTPVPVRPGEPAGPAGPPIKAATELLTYLVIVEEAENCTPLSNPEELTFDITACAGDIIRLPAPHPGDCPIGPPIPETDVAKMLRYGQNTIDLQVKGAGTVRVANWMGNFDDMDCPHRTYIYNISCSNNSTSSDAIFSTFAWLTEYVDPTNCSGESIMVYQSGAFQYVYIASAAGGQLYFQDGTFYCQDSPNYDCREAYRLTEVVDTWTCSAFDLPASEERTARQFAKPDFRVFPNPTTGLISVQLAGNQKDKQELRVLDVLGRVLLDKVIEPAVRTVAVDLSDYQSGVYYLELSASGQRLIKKVVKQELD